MEVAVMLTCHPANCPTAQVAMAPQQHADGPADQAERHRFDQKLRQDVLAARAHRHAQADLARTFGHADQHDVS